MDQDERGGAELKRPADHLARVDRRVVDGAALLGLVGDQPVLPVEKQQVEALEMIRTYTAENEATFHLLIR